MGYTQLSRVMSRLVGWHLFKALKLEALCKDEELCLSHAEYWEKD